MLLIWIICTHKVINVLVSNVPILSQLLLQVCNSHFVVLGIKSFTFLCGMQGILRQSEHQILNGSHIFGSPTWILGYIIWSKIFGKFQYLHKRIQDEEGNNPIRLPQKTWCWFSVPQYQESNKGNWTLDACIHDNYESLEP